MNACVPELQLSLLVLVRLHVPPVSLPWILYKHVVPCHVHAGAHGGIHVYVRQLHLKQGFSLAWSSPSRPCCL